jgi:hypothetical protein
MSNGGGAPSGADKSTTSLWAECEIRTIIFEVQQRKSVDTLKLFGGPSGTLPSALAARTPAEVKERVDRCKASFDQAVAPWVPKCGVPELIAVLASEAAFCRTQRTRRTRASCELSADKSERARLEAARREARREVADVEAYLAAEAKLRVEAELDKAAQAEALSDAKALVDEEILRRDAREDELEQLKLRETESRRKLDRARLKVAALRGEILADTMEALIDTEVGMEPDDDVNYADDAEDNNGKSSGKARIKKSSKGAPADKDAAKDKENKENAATAAAAAASTSNAPSSEVRSAEQPEDARRMELRLLRNRLAMHMAEAEEWRASAEAEQRKSQLLVRARARVEEEGRPGGMKRLAPGPAPRSNPAPAQPVKWRKGTPKRALVLVP